MGQGERPRASLLVAALVLSSQQLKYNEADLSPIIIKWITQTHRSGPFEDLFPPRTIIIWFLPMNLFIFRRWPRDCVVIVNSCNFIAALAVGHERRERLEYMKPSAIHHLLEASATNMFCARLQEKGRGVLIASSNSIISVCPAPDITWKKNQFLHPVIVLF